MSWSSSLTFAKKCFLVTNLLSSYWQKIEEMLKRKIERISSNVQIFTNECICLNVLFECISTLQIKSKDKVNMIIWIWPCIDTSYDKWMNNWVTATLLMAVRNGNEGGFTTNKMYSSPLIYILLLYLSLHQLLHFLWIIFYFN